MNELEYALRSCIDFATMTLMTLESSDFFKFGDMSELNLGVTEVLPNVHGRGFTERPEKYPKTVDEA